MFDIFGFLLLIFILYGIVFFYKNGKRRTIEWIFKKEYNLIDWVYEPFYNFGFFRFGLHPAHFKVKIEDKNRNVKFFSVAVGGQFLISEKITIREIKKL